MYALHVISLNVTGKSPQILQGKRCNSYNQKYLQWPQLSFFREFNEKKMPTFGGAHWWRCALAVTRTSGSTSSGTNARGGQVVVV